MSESTASTSEWESVGIPDVVDEENDSSNSNQWEGRMNSVVVEIPENLFQTQQQQQQREQGKAGSERGSTTSSAILVNQVSKMNIKSSFGSCNASVSSFIDIPNSATYRSNDDDSSWSHVPSAVEGNSSFYSTSSEKSISVAGGMGSTSSASSVVSNFDVLSLSGRVYRRCKRCSYHNSERATICIECDLALVANPCLDMDAQIAMNLQRKEEEESFRQLQEMEKKRKEMATQPLIKQVDPFVSDLDKSMSALPQQFRCFRGSCFYLLLLEFLNQVREQKGAVNLAYKFTPDDDESLDIIRRHGFGDSTEFSHDVDTALFLFDKPGMVRSGDTLFSIPEHDHPDEPFAVQALGWIVAVVGCTSSIVDIPGVEGGKNVSRSSQILPLASFHPSMRKNADVLNFAFQTLERTCQDFFQAIYGYPSTDGDDDLARAIAASLADVESSYQLPVPKKLKIDDTQKVAVTVADMASICPIVASQVDALPRNVTSGKAKPKPDDPEKGATVCQRNSDDEFEALWAEELTAYKKESMFGTDAPARSSNTFPDQQGGGPTPDTFLDGLFRENPTKPRPNTPVSHNIIRNNDEQVGVALESKENLNDITMIGKRVVILEGTFIGHIGKVAKVKDNHLQVTVETIRSHQPTVMLALNCVKLAGSGN